MYNQRLFKRYVFIAEKLQLDGTSCGGTPKLVSHGVSKKGINVVITIDRRFKDGKHRRRIELEDKAKVDASV